MAIKDPDELRDGTTACLKYLLGITATTINSLVRRNLLVQIAGPRGHFDLGDAVKAYIRYRVHGGEEGAKAKKYEQEVRKLQIFNDEREGKLIEVEYASELFSEYSAGIRAGVTALPGRLASQLSGMSKPAEIRALIHAEITELLDASEEVLGEIQANGQAKTDSAGGSSGVKGATQPNNRRVGQRKPRTTTRKRRARKVA